MIGSCVGWATLGVHLIPEDSEFHRGTDPSPEAAPSQRSVCLPSSLHSARNPLLLRVKFMVNRNWRLQLGNRAACVTIRGANRGVAPCE